MCYAVLRCVPCCCGSAGCAVVTAAPQASHKVPPVSVTYQSDEDGSFRGVAVLHYRTPGAAAFAYNLLNGEDLAERKLRIEYKKKEDQGRRRAASLAAALGAPRGVHALVLLGTARLTARHACRCGAA